MRFRSSSLVCLAFAVLAVFVLHILVPGGGAAKAADPETPPQRRGSGKRSFLIASKAASLHKTPSASAEVVAKLEPEVLGEIRSCSGDWCRVRTSAVSGWIERTDLWGVYKSEPIN